MKINYLSQEGFDKLNEELRDLKTRGRREIAAKIDEARSHGDLSENAEYEAAKEEQAYMEKRIAELENAMAHARVLDDKNVDLSKVTVLSTVTVLNKKTSKQMKYTLVSPQEADFDLGKISIESPIGAALMGNIINDVVQVKVPAGVLELEILNIER
ncbi:MAG TPA: transcription elongation factor GreA [Bacteroidetes bacterium]|nr:transcription elongation factor GreA [Bacteroidota bacterium]